MSALVLQPDGKIVAGGWDGRPITMRFDAGGRLDPTFGSVGVVKGPPPTNSSTGETIGLRVLDDGTIVVVRRLDQPLLSSNAADPGGLSIIRLRADGTQIAAVEHAAPEWTLQAWSSYGRWVRAVVGSDGSVVAAGNVSDPEPFTRACPCEIVSTSIVRRFRADGSVDLGFGQAGRTMASTTRTYARDMAVAGDGSIVVVGAAAPGGNYIATRYRADGSLDPTFGTNGTFRLDVEAAGATANRVALASDGGVFLADEALTVVRLDRNGQLVASFGEGGRARSTNVGGATALFPDADGGIRVATTDFRLVRFGPTGVQDPVFVGEPIQAALKPRGAHAVAASRRSGAVVAGWVERDDGHTAAHVARTGSGAGAFGQGGEVTLALGERAEATAVAVDGADRTVVAGVEASADERRWFVARLATDGTPDDAFGDRGIARPFAAAADAAVTGAAILSDGRVLLLGRAADAVWLVRLRVDGSLDPSFGRDGRVRLPVGLPARFAPTADGGAVVVAFAAGTLSMITVETNGVLSAPVSAGLEGQAAGVAVGHDGAVVAAATTTDGTALARWYRGALDPAFGADGVATRAGFDPVGVAIQRDGKIVVGANARTAFDSPSGMAVLRFLHSGRADGAFGVRGVARAVAGATTAAVAVGGTRIFAAGVAATAAGPDLALAELHQASSVAPVADVSVHRVAVRGMARIVATNATQPSVAPNGKRVAYIGDDDGAPAVFVAATQGGRPRRLAATPLGDLVVIRAAPVWSRDSRLLAVHASTEDGTAAIAVFHADGRMVRLIRGTCPSWGPQGQLAFARADQVHVMDVKVGTQRVVARGSCPAWSPRGNVLATGDALRRLDGSRVAWLPTVLRDVSWRPDGKTLVGIDAGRVVAVDLRGRRVATYARVGPDAHSPVFSRDGRWIALIGRGGGYRPAATPRRLVIIDARTRRRVDEWGIGAAFDYSAPSWAGSSVYVAIAT